MKAIQSINNTIINQNNKNAIHKDELSDCIGGTGWCCAGGGCTIEIDENEVEVGEFSRRLSVDECLR